MSTDEQRRPSTEAGRALRERLLTMFRAWERLAAEKTIHVPTIEDPAGFILAIEAEAAGPSPAAGLDPEALRLLDDLIEGTTPDRIGRYEYLRDWVHKTATKARARLSRSGGEAPPDPRWCHDHECPLLEQGVWGHPVSAHASWGLDR